MNRYDAKKPVVLHLIGAGRSGSTLLNIMLDNHPAIVGTGELTFLSRAWLRGDYCSCGRPLRECPFWNQVREEWTGRTGMAGMEEYLVLQNSFERYRWMPRTLFELLRPTAKFERYRSYTRQLFEVIQDIGDAVVVADSSKIPARVLSLSEIPGIDLRLIFLVRDCRGYVWSRKKAFLKDQRSGLGRTLKPSPIWRTSLQWQAINLISEWVLKRVDKSVQIRYEDLLDSTERVFSTIGSLIDLDLSSLGRSIALGKTLKTKHIAAGNRLRMQHEITLRRNETWQRQMSRKDKSMSWLLAGWLMRRYGYSKSDKSDGVQVNRPS